MKHDLPLTAHLLLLARSVLLPALLVSGLILTQFGALQRQRSEGPVLAGQVDSEIQIL